MSAEAIAATIAVVALVVAILVMFLFIEPRMRK